jgi:hypothetical protein
MQLDQESAVNRIMTSALGATLLLAAGMASAEMYRWVDADGKVHYSDRAVSGAQSVEVKTPGTEPAAPAGDTDTPASAPTDSAEPGDEAAQVKAKQCELARQRLQTYESSDSIVRTDESGKQVTLSAEERVDTILRARKDVRAFCGQSNN